MAVWYNCLTIVDVWFLVGNGLLKAFGVESQRHMSAENTDAPSRKPWILRWLNDETDEQRVMDLKEKEEREEILRRVRKKFKYLTVAVSVLFFGLA